MNEAQRVIEQCMVMATPENRMNWDEIENLYCSVVELFRDSSLFVHSVISDEAYSAKISNDKKVLYAINQIGKDITDFKNELDSLRKVHEEQGKSTGFVDSEQYSLYLQIGQGYSSWFAKFNSIVSPNVTIVQEFVAKQSLEQEVQPTEETKDQ